MGKDYEPESDRHFNGVLLCALMQSLILHSDFKKKINYNFNNSVFVGYYRYF